MRGFEDRDPELTFPCRWSYTLVGRDEAELRAVAKDVAGDREPRLEFSKRSAKGTYCSVVLEVTVESHEERRALFDSLRERPEVAYLL